MRHIACVPGCFCDCQAFSFVAIFRLDQPIIPRLLYLSRFGQDLCTALQTSLSSLLPRLPSLVRTRYHLPIYYRELQNQLARMVSVATTASMDLTAVVPTLMQGIAQKVERLVSWRSFSLEMNSGQFDLKLFQTLQAQYDKVEWDYAPFDQHHNPEPYLEIRLIQWSRMCLCLQAHSASQQAIARNREIHPGRASSWPLPSGELRLLLERTPIQTLFAQWKAKSPAREQSRWAQSNHSRLVATSPLPSLRCRLNHSCMSRLGTPSNPTSGQNYALEFNFSYAGVTGIAFSLSTLYQHRWNASIDWSNAVAQTDLLTMYDLRYALKSILWAMGRDWTKLPEKRDPSYRHPANPSIDQGMERSSQPMTKSRRMSQTNAKQANSDDLVGRLGPRRFGRRWPCWVAAYPRRGSLLRAASTRELASSSMNISAQIAEAARFLGELVCQYVASLPSLSCLQSVPPRLWDSLRFRRRVRRCNEEECYMLITYS